MQKTQITNDNIKLHYLNLKIKHEAIQEKKQEAHKNDKYYKLLLPILLAIYHTYQSDDSLKGFKGYRKATTNVLLHDLQHISVLDKIKQFF